MIGCHWNAETFKKQSIHMFIITHYPHCSSFPLIKTYTITWPSPRQRPSAVGAMVRRRRRHRTVERFEQDASPRRFRFLMSPCFAPPTATLTPAVRDPSPASCRPYARRPRQVVDHAMHRASAACRYQRPYSHEDDTPKHVPCIRKPPIFLTTGSPAPSSLPTMPRRSPPVVASSCATAPRPHPLSRR
ncbi:hypothetical protein pclt_cds_669 [Pandoravirus celtis]|uniref:Uncharacterized protein n=1 Tax=Pandoravirus celtis TaxID=2568002 RepID=A0A4D6EHH6_9VIRU|nr:hypothetical protein pclt_cds_669 [Pandoravirus celtis]